MKAPNKAIKHTVIYIALAISLTIGGLLRRYPDATKDSPSSFDLFVALAAFILITVGGLGALAMLITGFKNDSRPPEADDLAHTSVSKARFATVATVWSATTCEIAFAIVFVLADVPNDSILMFGLSAVVIVALVGASTYYIAGQKWEEQAQAKAEGSGAYREN